MTAVRHESQHTQRKTEREREGWMWQMLQVYLSTQYKPISNLLEKLPFSIELFQSDIWAGCCCRYAAIVQTIETRQCLKYLHFVFMLYLWYYQTYTDQLPHFQTCQTDKSNELKGDFFTPFIISFFLISPLPHPNLKTISVWI